MYLKRLSRGFTLIELMLTIAIMAAFVTVGIAAYQQKMQNAKVEQAALQIQTWLQAGLAYRVQDLKGKWPKELEDLVKKDYIKNYSSPWCQTDKTQPGQCFGIYTSLENDNFGVKMPFPKDVPNAQNLAVLIANRLPNATVESSSQTPPVVKAEVPFPVMAGGGSQPNGVVIKDIRFISNAENKGDDPYKLGPETKLSPVNEIACSANQEPKRFYSLVSFDGAPRTRFLAAFPAVWGAGVAEKQDKSVIYPQTDVLAMGTLSPDYKGKVLVIDACMPKKSAEAKTMNTATYHSYRY